MLLRDVCWGGKEIDNREVERKKVKEERNRESKEDMNEEGGKGK